MVSGFCSCSSKRILTKDPPPYFCTDCFSIEYFTPLVVTDERIRKIHRHLRVKDLVKFEQEIGPTSLKRSFVHPQYN